MKFKSILPWLLVLGLGAALAAVYFQGSTKDSELNKLREENKEVEQLRADLAAAQQKSQLPEDQVVVSRKDKDELIKLRGEVSTLRGETQNLSQQVSRVKTEADAAKAQTAQAIQNSQSTAARLATLQLNTDSRQKLDVCIDNLRQINGAKQQWALENVKTRETVPTAKDILPYFQKNALPVCPAAGIYTLNAVGQAPTCSIAGHVLPSE